MADYNVTPSSGNFDQVRQQAGFGDRVFLSGGTIDHNELGAFAPGVSVIGAGSGNTTLRCISSSQYWYDGSKYGNVDPDADCGTFWKHWTWCHFQYGQIGNNNTRVSAGNAIVSGFKISGKGTSGEERRLYGGFIFQGVSDLTIEDIHSDSYMWGSCRMLNLENVSLTNFRFENGSWGCPSGNYSLSAFSIHNMRNCLIKDGFIIEEDRIQRTFWPGSSIGCGGGGGLKTLEGYASYDNNDQGGQPGDPGAVIIDTTIENVDFQVPVENIWQTGSGQKVGNIDAEMYRYYAENVVFRDCTFRTNISLVLDPSIRPPSGRYSYRVIGCNWLQIYSDKASCFEFEAISDVEVAFCTFKLNAGNSVFYDRAENSLDQEDFPRRNRNIHHNYFETNSSSYHQAIYHQLDGVDGLYFWNNTIKMNNVTRDLINIVGAHGGNSSNVFIFNNNIWGNGSRSAGGAGSGDYMFNIQNGHYINNGWAGYNAATNLQQGNEGAWNLSSRGGGFSITNGGNNQANTFVSPGGGYPNDCFLPTGSPLEGAGIDPANIPGLPSEFFMAEIPATPASGIPIGAYGVSTGGGGTGGGTVYAASSISIDCGANGGDGSFTWTNDEDYSGTARIERIVNGDPNWRTDVDNILITGKDQTQTVGLFGMVTNPPVMPDEISGYYGYRLVVGSYISPTQVCIKYKEPNLSATVNSDTEITLDWAFNVYPGDEGLFSFQLQRYEVDTWITIANPTFTTGVNNYSFQDTSRTASTTYQYRLLILFDSTGVSGVPDATDTFTSPTVTATTTGVISDPYSAINVQYIRSGPNTVPPFLSQPGAGNDAVIRWTNQGDTTGQYVAVDRQVNDQGWENITVVPAGVFGETRSIQAPPLKVDNGTLEYVAGKYEIRLRYGDSAINNDPTNLALGTISSPIPVLNWFVGMVAFISNVNETNLTLNYQQGIPTAQASIFNFSIERSTNGGLTWTPVSTVVGDGPDHQGNGVYQTLIENLAPGTQYSFRVRAILVAGGETGAYSNTATATTGLQCNTQITSQPTTSQIDGNGQFSMTIPISKTGYSASMFRVVFRGNSYDFNDNGNETQTLVISQLQGLAVGEQNGFAVTVYPVGNPSCQASVLVDIPVLQPTISYVGYNLGPCIGGVHTITHTIQTSNNANRQVSIDGVQYSISGTSGTFQIQVSGYACDGAQGVQGTLSIPNSGASTTFTYNRQSAPVVSQTTVEVRQVVSGACKANGKFDLTLVIETSDLPTNRNAIVLGQTIALQDVDGEQTISVADLPCNGRQSIPATIYLQDNPSIGDSFTYTEPLPNKEIRVTNMAVEDNGDNTVNLVFTVEHQNANGESIALNGQQYTITTSQGSVVFRQNNVSLGISGGGGGSDPDPDRPTFKPCDDGSNMYRRK